MNNIVMIDINKLYPHPDNPRKELGDLSELADSIKARGVMQNLTVIPRGYGTEEKYTVIIGHRRLAASKLAGLTEVPCVVTHMTEREQLATMLLENMQRSDLTVYEQAQGFQLMIDLGESVKDIADKTGFSETTVRRRLKMAQLDQSTLKEISSRQISLEDFDKLAEIEDADKRNELLKSIGTGNFNQAVATAVKKQNVAKKLPLVKDEIKRLKAKRITWSETYGGKYDSICSDVYFASWDTSKPLFDVSDDENRKLYYYLDEDYGKASLFVERPKPKPVKRPQAEIDRDRYIQETRMKLEELSDVARQLRADFVMNLSVTKSNISEILKGAVLAAALNTITYISSNSGLVYDTYGIDKEDYNVGKYERTIDAIINGAQNDYPKVIYAAFGDAKDRVYYDGYRSEFPRHKKDIMLDTLYKWLIALGYEMSDEERALRDGTHALFQDKDKRGG